MVAPTYLGATTGGAATASATSKVCNYPTSSSGDLIVLHVAFSRSSTAANAISVPAGWNLIPGSDITATGSGVGISNAMFWRIRGAETSVTVTIAATAFCMYQSFAYSGSTIDSGVPIGAYNASSSNASTGSALSSPAITTGSIDNSILSVKSDHRTSFSIAYTHTWSAPATEYTDQYSGTDDAESVTSAGFDYAPAGTVTSFSSTSTEATDANYMAALAIQPPQFADIYVTETAAGTEDANVTGSQGDSDVGAGSDDASVGTTGSETAAGVDDSTVTAQTPGTDTAAGADTASVAADVTDSDTSTATDDAYVSNTVTGTETAGLSLEEATVIWQQYASETATGTDNAFVVAVAVASDTASAIDDAMIAVSAAMDEAEATDNASRSVEGVLSAPRVYTILPDERSYTVPSEPRTIYIEREYRTLLVGSESNGNSNAADVLI